VSYLSIWYEFYIRLYFLTSIFQKTQTQGKKNLKTQGKKLNILEVLPALNFRFFSEIKTHFLKAAIFEF